MTDQPQRASQNYTRISFKRDDGEPMHFIVQEEYAEKTRQEAVRRGLCEVFRDPPAEVPPDLLHVFDEAMRRELLGPTRMTPQQFMEEVEANVERLRPYLDQLGNLKGGEVFRDAKGDDQC